MNCFYVLQNEAVIDNDTRVYSYHYIGGVGHYCIDIVYHTWDAEDCKRGLIDHDWYNPNILVVSAKSLQIKIIKCTILWVENNSVLQDEEVFWVYESMEEASKVFETLDNSWRPRWWKFSDFKAKIWQHYYFYSRY